MDNPFETASALVGDLQGQYDALVKAIPKLKENHKAATEELAAVNKKLVVAQTKLDDILEQIKTNTDNYNAWQRAQLAELKVKQDEFATEKATHEADMVSKAGTIGGQVKAVEVAQAELTTGQTKLVADQKELAEQVKANNKWAENLRRQEAEQVGVREELINMGNTAGERSQELDEREAKIDEAGKEATELVQAAEIDRKSAKQLLDDAKETIANNDAKEDALNIRERQLKAKEADLAKKEVALNDRASVLASH